MNEQCPFQAEFNPSVVHHSQTKKQTTLKMPLLGGMEFLHLRTMLL